VGAIPRIPEASCIEEQMVVNKFMRRAGESAAA